MSPVPELGRAAWQLLAGPDRTAVAVPTRAVRTGIWLGLAVLFLVDFVQLAAGGINDRLVVTVLAVAHTGAVALALRRPLLGWRLSFLTTAVTPLLVSTVPVPGPTSTLVLHLCALFLLAVAAPPAVAVLGVAVAALAGAGWALVAAAPAALVGVVAAPVLVAGLGSALRSLRGTTSRLAEAERGTAAEQARRAVLEERTRIARELHDVVAHHLSAIAVRAESAPHRAPANSSAEFTAIASAARDALAEMRRLLGLLRADDPDRPGAPVPSVDGIADLVAGLRGSGMAVELDVAGSPRPVPGDVGLVAYRVVQEALSNAARHATGAAVTVRVQWLPDAVRVQVHNGVGNGDGADSGSGGGAGLLGMRERVAAVDGFLIAGPGADGYTVDATLPTGGAR